jgi:hypothetical protein
LENEVAEKIIYITLLKSHDGVTLPCDVRRQWSVALRWFFLIFRLLGFHI